MTKHIDIDEDWDPEQGSLHDHRLKTIAQIEQAGFGKKPTPVDTQAGVDLGEISTDTGE